MFSEEDFFNGSFEGAVLYLRAKWFFNISVIRSPGLDVAELYETITYRV